MSQTRHWRPQEAPPGACGTHLAESPLQVQALHLMLQLFGKEPLGYRGAQEKCLICSTLSMALQCQPCLPPKALTKVTAENQRDLFLATLICMTSKAKSDIIQRTEISWWICLPTQFPSGNSRFSPAQDRKGLPWQVGRKRFFSARELEGTAPLPVR